MMRPSHAQRLLLVAATSPIMLAHAHVEAVQPPASAIVPPGAAFVSSQPAMLRFGVEHDWPNLTRLDLLHTDLIIAYSGGQAGFGARIADNSPTEPVLEGLFYTFDEAHIYAGQNSHYTLQTAVFEPFTGASIGDELWNLPQTQEAGQIFLGFNSAEVDLGRLVEWNPADAAKNSSITDRWLMVNVTDVRYAPSAETLGQMHSIADGHGGDDGAPGPGAQFAMWQVQSFGTPLVWWSTFDGGIDAADVYYHPAGSHQHFNWSFTAPGYYEVDIVVSTFIPCRADFNTDGARDVADLFAYINAWLAKSGDADFNTDDAVDVADLFAYINAWLAGC